MIRESESAASRPTGREVRLEQAREILRQSGLPAVVDASGPRSEIVAIRAHPRLMPELRRLAPDLRALGFRYVALDVTAQDSTE